MSQKLAVIKEGVRGKGRGRRLCLLGGLESNGFERNPFRRRYGLEQRRVFRGKRALMGIIEKETRSLGARRFDVRLKAGNRRVFGKGKIQKLKIGRGFIGGLKAEMS